MIDLPSGHVLMQVTVVGVLTGGVYALMVSGLALIFGVMRVINVAHGAFLILAAYASYWLFTSYGIDPMISVLVTAPAFLLLGAVVQKSVLDRGPQDPGLLVLVTFAVAIVLSGVMGAAWKSTFRAVRTGYREKVFSFAFGDLPLRLPLVRLIGFATAVIVLVLLYLLLTRTDLGRAIRATMQNPDAAQLVGVNVSRVKALTFGIGLSTVAGGGAIFSLIWSFNADSHEVWISKMLSIIVLGGMGSVPGALIAALLMGVLEAVASVTVTTYLSPIVFYLVLFLVLIFRPQGLMGTRVREG